MVGLMTVGVVNPSEVKENLKDVSVTVMKSFPLSGRPPSFTGQFAWVLDWLEHKEDPAAAVAMI